ncbi:MAG: hypothetical protein M0Q23_05175 [Syntrophales bacterium]|jgi:P pilus assembly chaperone PapD|nr:hypothetical protein [Syntrophales bacterium]MCK9528033.1 hypothetical protein [Syntrophales bacterium]MDX9921390.1 hypothetical protein [Syntrophales bacterium]
MKGAKVLSDSRAAMKDVVTWLGFTGVAALLVLLTAAPVVAEISVVGALSRHMVLAPGDEAQGRVIVRNQGTRDRIVRVRLTDYRSRSDGTTRYGEAGRLDRSNAPWVHVVPRERVIPANSSSSFTFIARVPHDPSLAGTYWSMLLVEPLPMEVLRPPDEHEGRPRLNIRTTVRTGIHLIIHIRGTGRTDARFQGQMLEETEGRPVLRFDLENTGERHLNVAVWTELFDEQGLSIGRFDAPRQALLPGNSSRVRVALPGVPSGAYSALVIADDGRDNVFGARYEIVIP